MGITARERVAPFKSQNAVMIHEAFAGLGENRYYQKLAEDHGRKAVNETVSISVPI